MRTFKEWLNEQENIPELTDGYIKFKHRNFWLKCNPVLAKQKFFSLLCRHLIPNLNPSLILFIKSL